MTLTLLTAWWLLTALTDMGDDEVEASFWLFNDQAVCEGTADALIADEERWPDLIAAGCERLGDDDENASDGLEARGTGR